jgi:electron transfer flavoprotein beta subunit
MKILVCCKAVPEGISKIRLGQTGNKIEYESYSMVMNESDECALEEALALKRDFGAEIAVITMGSLRSQAILHAALAKGADKVIRIDSDFSDFVTVPRVIAEAIKSMEYDLILTGVESNDYMSSQTGVSVAERLNLPHAFAVVNIEMELEQNAARVTTELGHGVREVIDVPLPAVLCIQSSTRSIRRASVVKLLRARKQPVESIDPNSLKINWDQENSIELRLLDVFEPPRTGNCEMIQGSLQEIAHKLKSKIDNV